MPAQASGVSSARGHRELPSEWGIERARAPRAAPERGWITQRADACASEWGIEHARAPRAAPGFASLTAGLRVYASPAGSSSGRTSAAQSLFFQFVIVVVHSPLGPKLE